MSFFVWDVASEAGSGHFPFIASDNIMHGPGFPCTVPSKSFFYESPSLGSVRKNAANVFYLWMLSWGSHPPITEAKEYLESSFGDESTCDHLALSFLVAEPCPVEPYSA